MTGMTFVDCDLEISEKSGMSIDAIFDVEGEDGFRDRESIVLREVLSGEEKKIISTGGGVVLRSENRSLLKSRKNVIYLTASPELLAERLEESRSSRPLLKGTDDLRGELSSLLASRDALYRDVSQHILSIDEDLEPKVAASRIIEILGGSYD